MGSLQSSRGFATASKRKMIDKREIGEIRDDLRQWKRTLRVGKNKKNVERLEKVSDMKLSLEEITHVVDDDHMWAKFDKKLRHGVSVSDNELKLAMCSLMVTIKLKSMLRPGAVCNCTIEEYRADTVSDEVTVVKVKKHKTGKYGSANGWGTRNTSKAVLQVCKTTPGAARM